MYLTPFEENDYSVLVDWVPSEEFSLLWGGPLYSWPLTVLQIAEHQKMDGVISFWLISDGEKIGFIEIYKVSKVECRLCRVIINEGAGRGKGYGKQLVKLAIKHAEEQLNAEVVTLSVFEHNIQAVKCYESLGFRVYEHAVGEKAFKGTHWPLQRMKLFTAKATYPR